MTTRQATITNTRGIHLRPSSLIASALDGFAGEATIVCHGRRHRLQASPLAIMALGLRKGDAFSLDVAGPEEESLCERLADLFSRTYDYTET